MARGDQRRALSEAGPGGSCARRAAVELRLWPESTLLDLGGWRARGAARLPVAARRDEGGRPVRHHDACRRSEEHTSELQSLMRISYAVFCLKKKKKTECVTITNHDI